MSVALSTIPATSPPDLRVMDSPAAAARKRKPMRLTPAGREERTTKITQYQAKGTAASAARPPEERSRSARFGGLAKAQKYQTLMAACTPDSPDEIKRERIEVEAIRKKILSNLIDAAQEESPKTDVVKAALHELRIEADRLMVKEREAIAARAAGLTPKVPTANPSESPADPDKPSVLASD